MQEGVYILYNIQLNHELLLSLATSSSFEHKQKAPTPASDEYLLR